jgi:single-strand DNA-binding protein
MSNHITVTGNLTREPQLDYISNGTAKLTTSVASSRWVGKKGEGGTEYTSFFNVVVWGGLAEHCMESLKKGDRVTLVGRLDQRSYVDEQHNRRTVFEVVAEEVAVSLRFRTAMIDRPVRITDALAPDVLTHDHVTDGEDAAMETPSHGEAQHDSDPDSTEALTADLLPV